MGYVLSIGRWSCRFRRREVSQNRDIRHFNSKFESILTLTCPKGPISHETIVILLKSFFLGRKTVLFNLGQIWGKAA